MPRTTTDASASISSVSALRTAWRYLSGGAAAVVVVSGMDVLQDGHGIRVRRCEAGRHRGVHLGRGGVEGGARLVGGPRGFQRGDRSSDRIAFLGGRELVGVAVRDGVAFVVAVDPVGHGFDEHGAVAGTARLDGGVRSGAYSGHVVAVDP